MITITLYTRKSDEKNEAILKELEGIQAEHPHRLVMIDVETDPALKDKYKNQSPVIEIGPYNLQYPFSAADLRVVFGAARDRSQQLNEVDGAHYQRQLADGHRVTGADRVSYWLSRNYMWILNFFLAAYLGTSFLAPVLMKAGYEPAAKVIYTLYSPMCHQLAFRSFFLFGEQAFYPKEMAKIPGMIPYETINPVEDPNLFGAKDFLGDAQLGYKVALCQRDVAMYGGLLLFGILFSLFGQKWKSLPWYIWLVIGILPIGLDGGSQLTSLIPGLNGLGLARESNPFLRTLTGGLFGITTAWYMFPLIEESMLETRRIVTRKMAIQKQLHSTPE